MAGPTAFQANAFQTVVLAFQIGDVPPPTPPSDMVGTDGHGASPGIQWVSMEVAHALRRRLEHRRYDTAEERASVRRQIDEVIAGPPPLVLADVELVPILPAPVSRAPEMIAAAMQAELDRRTRKLILDEIRRIQAEREQDEDDVEVLLLTMH